MPASITWNWKAANYSAKMPAGSIRHVGLDVVSQVLRDDRLHRQSAELLRARQGAPS